MYEQEKLNFNTRNQKVIALQSRREEELIGKGTMALLNFIAYLSNMSLFQ